MTDRSKAVVMLWFFVDTSFGDVFTLCTGNIRLCGDLLGKSFHTVDPMFYLYYISS